MRKEGHCWIRLSTAQTDSSIIAYTWMEGSRRPTNLDKDRGEAPRRSARKGKGAISADYTLDDVWNNSVSRHQSSRNESNSSSTISKKQAQDFKFLPVALGNTARGRKVIATEEEEIASSSRSAVSVNLIWDTPATPSSYSNYPALPYNSPVEEPTASSSYSNYPALPDNSPVEEPTASSSGSNYPALPYNSPVEEPTAPSSGSNYPASPRNPPFLCLNGSGHFELGGKQCAENCLRSDSYCAVMDYFGLVYVSSEGFFACVEHRSLIPFSWIPRHFPAKHNSIAGGWFEKANPGLLSLAIAHLARISGVDANQATWNADIQRERSQKIDVLPPPVRCVQCPSCSHWFKLSDSAKAPCSPLIQLQRLHLDKWKNNIKNTERTTSCNDPDPSFPLKIRMTQFLFFGIESVKSAKISISPSLSESLATSWQEPGRSDKVPPLLTGAPIATVKGEAPAYLVELGWPKWFADTKAEAADVLALIAPPRKIRSWMTPSERKLEKRLVDVDNYCAIYLLDGNEWVETHHRHLRQAMTEGSGSDIQ
jgi:hypothetical protein